MRRIQMDQIDIELLRAKVFGSCRAACFGEEFRRVYYDAYEVENASDEELIRIAARMGIDLSAYEKSAELEGK